MQHIPTCAEGMLLARDAYVTECKRQGREPTPTILDGFDRGFLGSVKMPTERAS